MNPDDNKPKEWREWTMSDGGDYYYLDGPSPSNSHIAELPFKVIERAALTQAEARAERAEAYVKACASHKEFTSVVDKLTDAEREIAGLHKSIDHNWVTHQEIIAARELVDRLTKENAELRDLIYAEDGYIESQKELIRRNEEQAKEIESLKRLVKWSAKEKAESDSFRANLIEANEIIAVLEEKLKLIKSGSGRAEILGLEKHLCPQCASTEIATDALVKLSEWRGK